MQHKNAEINNDRFNKKKIFLPLVFISLLSCSFSILTILKTDLAHEFTKFL